MEYTLDELIKMKNDVEIRCPTNAVYFITITSFINNSQILGLHKDEKSVLAGKEMIKKQAGPRQYDYEVFAVPMLTVETV